MDATKTGWWHRHGWTVAILLTAFSFAFAIRTIWSYPVIAQWGPLYTYAGGSDSYYHSRVMQYIILTHTNLVHDPMLKFPVGSLNPREPLFDWMNAILGLIFAPFFGGNAVTAGAWFLDLQGPLWAALEVFPLYLIGREVSSKRTGLIAALILPFLSSSIDESTFGYANYLSFYTFVILVVVYAYLRMIKAVGTRRWVASYARPGEYWPALKAFVRTERTAVKWAVFTGVSLGALALAWQGYTYAIVVIGMTLLIAMLVERVRKVDSFGLYVSTWIIGLIAFPMAMPYYLVQGNLPTFFDLPVLLFFGVLALMLPFLLMRDIPWVFSIPSLVALVGAAALFLRFVTPTYFTDVVTGQGYFVKNLIYSTVAEAQPPTFDELVLAYGVITFFLAFVGIAIFVYLLARHKFRRWHIALLVYGILSVYLPISATKFFLVASPAYALLSAEALHRALDVGGYPTLRRTVASLSDRGSQLAAFRRAFKARHVLVMVLVVGIVLPNVWVAVDAGVPGNTKGAVENQIVASLPSWLKLNASAPASSYLGAVGTDLDTPNQYDSAAYNWLATQDTNVPEPARPAFISWWDYGFQAIDQGQHPSVADNFQNGINPAGQFLLAQNESLAIGVLATTLLSAEETVTHSTVLPSNLVASIRNSGVNVTKLEQLLANQAADYAMVVAHPDIYLPVDPSTITDNNAMYLAVSYFLAGSLSENNVAKLYNDLQAYTGWSIRYGMVDSRLFPFSGQDTGIFYAPADLTGRNINDAGLPTTYFNVTVLGSDGNTYPLGGVPADVSSVEYNINYFAPFYNSMLYRTYIGYNGTDIGLSGGIPGLSGAAAESPLEPGWMLQHFQIVYRTAYYCPGVKNATNGSACMLPDNYPTAKALANSTHGTFDSSALSYFQGGETMLAYYPGETLIGSVTTANGTPDAGVRVTVYDSWNIPHMSVVTGKTGNFTVVLPPGNDTLNITTGAVDGLSQAGKTVLRSVKIDVPDAVGYSYNAPPVVQSFSLAPGTLQGFVYWNTANNSSYSPSVDQLIAGAQVRFTSGGNLTNLTATTDASGSYLLANVPPGNYTSSVTFGGHTFSTSPQLVMGGSVVNATIGLAPGALTGTVDGTTGSAYAGAAVTVTNASGAVVATATTDANGTFRIATVAPGNYSVYASVAGSSLRSPAVGAQVTTNGTTPTGLTLKLAAMSGVSVEALAGGAPVAGISVRFQPLVSFAAGGGEPLEATSQAAANGTSAVTAANGIATASLPAGNYSVYALGYVGGTLSSALGRLAVTGSGASSFLALPLVTAVTLAGAVTHVTTGSGANLTAVLLYGTTTGTELLAAAAANGSYSIAAPPGSYSVVALQGSTGAGAKSYVALTTLNLTASSKLYLTTLPSTVGRFAVYANLSSGASFAASGATVNISVGPNGARESQLADPNGSVALVVPTSSPLSSGGYCLAAAAPGFSPTSRCGVTAGALGNLSTFLVPVATVPVTINVTGLPTGTPITVNLTAKSLTAISQSVTGGPKFRINVSPGTYAITARTAGNTSVIYQSPTPLNASVPFAGSGASIGVPVLANVFAAGTLKLPSGTAANNTTVTLSSSAMTVTVNGTTFLSGFRIAPGSYTAAVNATGTAGATANLTAVVVGTTGGTITPRLTLTRAAVKLTGAVVAPGDPSLAPNTTVTLTSGTGAVLTASVAKGSFSAQVPPSVNFTAAVTYSLLRSSANATYRETFAAAPGSFCAIGTVAASCTISLVGTVDPAWLNGTLGESGTNATIPGTLRFVGPYPSDNVSTATAPNGTFSVPLVPGAYLVYAVSSSGAAYAAFATATVSPLLTGRLALTLLPTWTDTISVGSTGATGQLLGPVTVSVAPIGGGRVVFANESVGSTVAIALPVGTYTETATATGSLNGVAGNATARATVRVATGNFGTTLLLGIAESPTVTAKLTSPASATVSAPGSATFTYSVQDTGNVPVIVHAVGAPVYWKFNFSTANISLVPGGTATTGEVHISVPAGTPVQHPTVAISFETANGTVAGAVTPAPTINVVPFNGVSLSVGVSAAGVGTASALVPFIVRNTGNTIESINLSLVDAKRLAGIGWSFAFTSNGVRVLPLVANVSAGYNATYAVNLTFNGTTFVAPGSVTVLGTVVGVKDAPSSSVTLAVKLTRISVKQNQGSTLTVTGPGVEAPPFVVPEWALAAIALAPSAALLIAIVARRWWKTRRWSRR